MVRVAPEQHHGDRRGDHESDDGIGPRCSCHDRHRTHHHGQRREAVGSGVHPVGHERGGADPAADAHAVDGHQLVPHEPDPARRPSPNPRR